MATSNTTTKKEKKPKTGLALEIDNIITSEQQKFQEANDAMLEEQKKAQQKEVDYLQKDLVTKAQELYGQDYTLSMKNGDDLPNFSEEVNKMINKQIDDIVLDRVKSIQKKWDQSNLNSMMQTANAYYKKILDSEKMMTQWRDDYTKAITKSLGNSIENKFNSLDKKLGKYGRLILPASLLGKNLSNFITGTMAGIINAVINSKTIANVSNALIGTVNRIKNSIKDKVTSTFKSQIDYYKKTKQLVEQKMADLKKLKDQYIAKAQAYVTKLQNAIMDQVKKLEDAAINEISKVIKLSLSPLGV